MNKQELMELKADAAAGKILMEEKPRIKPAEHKKSDSAESKLIKALQQRVATLTAGNWFTSLLKKKGIVSEYKAFFAKETTTGTKCTM